MKTRSIIVLCGVAAGVGLLLAATGAAYCAVTLHVPRKMGKTPANAATVEITAMDKAKLSAWWLRPAQPNGNCVIVLHGIADSRAGSAGFAPLFLGAGYSVLLPDSRAHGESGGKFVTYGLFEKYDVVGWADWMKQAGCRKLYGLGESLGASILIQATAERPLFAAAVAECPFADLRETAEFRASRMLRVSTFIAAPLAKIAATSGLLYARWVEGLRFDEVSPMRSIARSRTPILLIHGLDDSQTPAANSIVLAKMNPRNSLWLVPGAEHTGASSVAPEEFRQRVLGWFSEY